MAPLSYDVVVVGGGPIGLATAYEVAKAGKSVLVLEANNFFNQAGSSNDLARMYRTMYTEDFMADLAKESLQIWTELEEDAGVSLRSMTGLLNFGDKTVGDKTPEGSLVGPIKNLDRLKMSYELLNKDAIEARWPFKGLPDNWEGVFAPDNGVINLPLLLRTLARLAKDHGAELIQQVKVEKLTSHEDENETFWNVHARRTDQKELKYKGRKIVITAGAYSNHILQPSFKLKLDLDIWEMTAAYWNVNAGPEGTVFPSMWFQFANDKTMPDGSARSQLFYGFPAVEWGPPDVARISVDAATNRIDDPDKRRTTIVNPDDIADTQEFVKDHVVGVDATVPASILSCLQTNVYDNMFVLDYIPEEYLVGGEKDSVMIFTAGWAMKFVPLLGRALKEMALDGHSRYKRKEFRITREAKQEDGSIKSVIDKKVIMNTTNTSSFRKMGEQARGSSIHYRHVEIPLG